MNARSLASLTLLATTLLGACAAAGGDDDSDELIGDDESEIAAPCALGTTCPASVKVLSAREYLGVTRAPARLRSDISIVTQHPAQEATPRSFGQKTTRFMTLTEGTSVRLSGSADGSAPALIDDFLVVEVLDDKGKLVDVAFAGPAYDITVAGAKAKHLTSFEGDYRVAADKLDFTSILPKEGKFRLRISALDFAGKARVSDVYLVTGKAAPPPPPPPPPPPVESDDPFDAASCTGEALPLAAAAARFPPGGTWANVGRFQLVSRSRSCNKVTGCTAWSTLSQVSFGNADGGSHVANLPLQGTVAFAVAGETVGVHLISDVQTTGSSYTVHTAHGCSAAAGLKDAACTLYGSWGYRNMEPKRFWKVSVAGGMQPIRGILTDHCIRLATAPQPPTGATWSERESVILGRF